MSRRRRIAMVLSIAALLAGVAVALSIFLSPRTLPAAAWDDDLRMPVRLVDGDRTYDVELTDLPIVEGRVAYEGPGVSEDEQNWKASHVYQGIDLGLLIQQTVGRRVERLTAIALDGWYKTLPGPVLDGGTACGRVILALSRDGEAGDAWEDAPLLIFLPEDERFSNQDMLDALGSEYAHFFGPELSSTGLLVKGVAFLVVDHDGGRLPTLADF